jgi:hypothetical protein
MADNTLTLAPHQYGKLGVIHCGVTHSGFVAVGGDTADITDGQTLSFARTHIKVTRNGEQYTFTRQGVESSKAA